MLRPRPLESFLSSILLASVLTGDLAGDLAGDLYQNKKALKAMLRYIMLKLIKVSKSQSKWLIQVLSLHWP